MTHKKSSVLMEALIGAGAGVGAAYLMGIMMSKGPKLLEQAIPQTKNPQSKNEREEKPSTVKAAEKATHLVANKDIPEDKKQMAGQVVHYLTGATLGALYGIGFALLGRRTRWYMGPLYGMGVWILLDEFLVPALKLSGPPQRYSISKHATGLGAHLAYGALVHTALTAEETAMERLH